MSNMEKIAVWGFRWAPLFAQGLVRDLRVRWALEEGGLTYESRLIGIEELNTLPIGASTRLAWSLSSSLVPKP
jgi:hypothetical protein